ncbi:ABC transporter permease [Chitinilyticum piscinae]|uniref:ABC transporter permease n=1 Tax=Chitinilyticum piscinae TaxID=2866724 RepID=A0A8J7K2F0_9NEIS|nr:ABC transporter permease [Chitinilyticum piscinae]MBE9609952.1 ABC transporter permease [Chitinilyticum piscinae]
MTSAATPSLVLQHTGSDWALQGRLQLGELDSVWQQARQTLQPGDVLELAGLSHCDGAGAALLFELQHRGIILRGLAPDFSRLLAALQPERALPASPAPQCLNPISELGRLVAGNLDNWRTRIAFVGALLLSLRNCAPQARTLRLREIVRLCNDAGLNALPIMTLISLLLGIILAFQSALPMRQFGAEVFVANLLGLSLIRELSPLMMAIVLAGRTGAAYTAELGTMKVNEEINALLTFGIDPLRFLVLPRLIAVTLMAPLLTVFAELIGLTGGALVMKGFGIPFSTYFSQIAGAVDLGDFASGMIKASVYGMEIAGIGCLFGLMTGNGASAVGHSTTRAVVSMLVTLVVTDGLFAFVYYQMGW